jgi:hypothetical protein
MGMNGHLWIEADDRTQYYTTGQPVFWKFSLFAKQ